LVRRRLVDEMIAAVRAFNERYPEVIEWGGPELEHLERNAELFVTWIG
jgi:hypothetical protein